MFEKYVWILIGVLIAMTNTDSWLEIFQWHSSAGFPSCSFKGSLFILLLHCWKGRLLALFRVA
jgi:hypothetical protein